METASGLRTNRMGELSQPEMDFYHTLEITEMVTYVTSCQQIQLITLFFSSLFTDEEMQAIRNMTYYDVLLAVTSAEATDIQNNVFFWKDGKIKKHF